MEPLKKDEVAALMAKALKTQEPVTFRDRPCFLKPLTYQDDLILTSIVQDVCVEAVAAGVDQNVLNRVASMSTVLGLVKIALFDGETGLNVFPTMADINTATKENLKEYMQIQKLYDVYMAALELTKSEKKR